MRAARVNKTEIAARFNSGITVVQRDEKAFDITFHCHREMELVYIQEGFGRRVIGNSIEDFAAGDLIFIGPDLPHRWISDNAFYAENYALRSKALVIYFNADIFSGMFVHLNVRKQLADFFQNSKRGIQVLGEARMKVVERMDSLLLLDEYDLVSGLLQIIGDIFRTNEVRLLNSAAYLEYLPFENDEKIIRVLSYIKKHYSGSIKLNEVADVANITPNAFCRLFKRMLNKTFVEYLNEVRVSESCKYLQQTNLLLIEIAEKCGFQNLSSFHKAFKRVTNMTPNEYRKQNRVSTLEAMV